MSHTLGGWVIISPSLEQEERVILFPSQFVFKLDRRMRMILLTITLFQGRN